jgi:hypothetical protein
MGGHVARPATPAHLKGVNSRACRPHTPGEMSSLPAYTRLGAIGSAGRRHGGSAVRTISLTLDSEITNRYPKSPKILRVTGLQRRVQLP